MPTSLLENAGNMFRGPSGRRYKQIKVLGKGSYGMALLCEDASDALQQFVIKRVSLSRQSPKERHASVQELALMHQLKHRNLVNGCEYWIENGCTAFLSMAYAQSGDLAALLKRRQGSNIHEDDVKIMFVQIASAAAYLHANLILHRDIKTVNIFITSHGLLQLGDLGMCRRLESNSERPRTTARIS